MTPGTPLSVEVGYDHWSATYDTVQNATRDLAAEVLRRQDLVLKGAFVVELGCGTGLNTAWLAEQAEWVAAYDFSEGMLAKARERVGAKNVEFARQDVTEPLPLQDASVDVVVETLVLEHVEALARVFAEVARVLKPGGRFYLSELHPFRQAVGKQARFLDAEGQERKIAAYLHPVSEYLSAALAAGLKLAACEEAIPDIVLLDMKMGDTTGAKVSEELLSRWPGMCVIVITGYPSMEDMRATFKLKVFDYLAKPFTLAQLRQVLANAVEAFGLGKSAQDRLRERLGHAIKMLRVQRDWSLKELATHTKLSVSQISAIERGANLPSIESFLAIARAFDKKPSEMLSSIEF